MKKGKYAKQEKEYRYKKYQHYVPNFYLKNFSLKCLHEWSSRVAGYPITKRYVFLYDKVLGETFARITTKVAQSRYFYEDRSRYQVLERVLSRIERHIGMVYEDLRTKKSLSSLSNQEKKCLVAYLDLQEKRTRKVRDRIIEQLQSRYPSLSMEEVKMMARDEQVQMMLEVYLDLSTLRILKGGIINPFMKLRWILLECHGKKQFVTSDHPIVKLNALDYFPIVKNKIYPKYNQQPLKPFTKGFMLIHPINTELCLVLMDDRLDFLKEGVNVVDREMVDFVNAVIYEGAHRHVISMSKNVIGRMLKKELFM